jgi:hypothetical protein
MPKQAIDYSKTIIYKIVCNDLNIKESYIGSTINFRQRKHTHKSYCINEKSEKHKLKIYQTIRANGGWDNWNMIEIEKYSCEDGNEAKTRERYWIEKMQSSLNMNRPIITKEEAKQKMADLYKLNKERYNQYKKINHGKICEQRKKRYDKINERRRELYALKKLSKD